MIYSLVPKLFQPISMVIFWMCWYFDTSASNNVWSFCTMYFSASLRTQVPSRWSDVSIICVVKSDLYLSYSSLQSHIIPRMRTKPLFPMVMVVTCWNWRSMLRWWWVKNERSDRFADFIRDLHRKKRYVIWILRSKLLEILFQIKSEIIFQVIYF